MNLHLSKLHVLILVLSLLFACNNGERGTVSTGQAESSNSVLEELKRDFMLNGANERTDMRKDEAQAFVEATGFKLLTSGQQEGMFIDEYISEAFMQSSIVAVSIISVPDGNQQLAKIMVVAMHPNIEKQAEKYIKNALDSVNTGPDLQDKMYFLGYHRLGPSRLMKISLRVDNTPNTKTKVYSLQYASSEE